VLVGLSDNLTEALLFLAHIVGDIHQVFASMSVTKVGAPTTGNMQVWSTF
jgi:hypothetical protein